MKTSRQYDEECKPMAVELAQVKGALKVTAEVLGITPQILTSWRTERLSTQKANTSGRVGAAKSSRKCCG